MKDREATTRAEIIWCLQTVWCHYSSRSSASCVSLFSYMFPDSQIASDMALQRTKIYYNLVYGIAPYFREELISQVKNCEVFVVLFDESLNKIVQRGQMDLSIRFMYSNNGKSNVVTRYFDSAFLNHATAEILLESFLNMLKNVNLRKLLQVSMDGPNVNFKFLRLLKQYLNDNESTTPVLVELGSCGIHTVHNCFKCSFKIWDIKKFLVAIFALFHNVPARKGDYIEATGSSQFPKKFCNTRWVENSSVAETAIDQVANIEKYVKFVKDRRIEPTCNSYKIVCDFLKDPLLKAKLMFFQSFADMVEPFLTFFQDDKPLAPVLYEFLNNLLKQVLECIILKEVIQKSSNLTDIHVYDKKILVQVNNVRLRTSVRETLRECKVNSKVQAQFKTDVLKIYQSFCYKMTDKSPLVYKLTKAISFLDPKVAKCEELRTERFEECLSYFSRHKWISKTDCDKCQDQFTKICDDDLFLDSLKEFKVSKDRLDDFWLKKLNPADEFCALNKLFRLIFVLSHGNAFPERGFSVNKELLETNLRETSLVAQRIIYDNIALAGEVKNVMISKSLIESVGKSRLKYDSALKKQKENSMQDNEQQKQIKMASLKIKQLEEQKIQSQQDYEKDQAELNKQIKLLSAVAIKKR